MHIDSTWHRLTVEAYQSASSIFSLKLQNGTISKHGCHQQFLKHGQKVSFLLIWIMCFWFRKNSQGFLQQHRWQVMKSDGSCYNTMTSMHVDRRENLKGFPPTEFSVFLWFRHINKPLLYQYLSDERIYPLAPRRWSVHLLSRALLSLIDFKAPRWPRVVHHPRTVIFLRNIIVCFGVFNIDQYTV